MLNVTVININDVLKYLVGLTLTILVVVGLARYFNYNKDKVNINDKIKIVSQKSYVEVMDKTIPNISTANNNKQEQKDENNNILKKLLKVELSMLDLRKAKKDEENIETATSPSKNEKIELAEAECSTEVVTKNPLEEKYNAQYNNVKIKNETSYKLTEEMLKPDIKIKNKNVLIFHTHTCESYTPTQKYSYNQTGTFRTTDLNHSVSRVGDELEKYLKEYKFSVIHNNTFHDYPTYTGSYSRSLETVENILKDNKDTKVVIDLHRDAIGSRSDYAPTVKIGNDYVAQLMFVIGTNGGGLWHPNWNQNLKFAIKVQQKAEELYPGLFKPIILRNSRYNQHVTNAANIIEVGSTGNTLEQALTSMRYLSKVLNETINP